MYKSMNKWAQRRRAAEAIKTEYPKGTRVVVLQMTQAIVIPKGEQLRPIPAFTRGTVDFVDDTGTVHCYFDNGRYAGLIADQDDFRKLTKQEEAEE